MINMFQLRRALAANSTDDTVFSAKVATTTKPVSDDDNLVIEWANEPFSVPGEIPNGIELFPFGTDANNETFDLRVWAWDVLSESGTKVYVPRLLADFRPALGNLDASALVTSGFHADTITETTDLIGATTASPTADMCQAYTYVPIDAAELIQLQFRVVTAASCNCLWKPRAAE